MIPEKSTGPGTGKKWSQKKVPVPVPEKNLGTVTLCNIYYILYGNVYVIYKAQERSIGWIAACGDLNHLQ